MSDVVEEEATNGGDGVGGRGGTRECGGKGVEGASTGDAIQDNICCDSTEDHPVQRAIKRDSSGIPVRVPEHVADDGQPSTSGTRKLPTWLSKGGADMEQQYWKGFKERCDRVLRECAKSDGQLVRDVFRFEDPRECEDFLSCVRNDEHYRRGLLQICREDNHIHVVHDCIFSNGSCRCNWFKKAKTYGADSRRDRRAHRRNSCRSRTAADIQNLLFYYCTKGRTTIYQKIRGQVERLSSEGYNLSTSRLDGMPQIIGEMEVQIPGIGAELQQWEPDVYDDEPDQRETYAVHKRPKRRKLGAQERIQLRTVEILETYPICPPEAIVKHKVWRDDADLRFKNVSDREIKAAINSFKDSLTTYSMIDFQNMYNKEKCDPIFSAGFGNYETYYYNIENSVKIMDDLVQFQCGGDEDATMDFVNTLYNVLERKVPKLNCMVIMSPPSAGKNYFFDAVKDFYLNCGHLCNANKFNNFPFQELRAIVGFIPQYNPTALSVLEGKVIKLVCIT